MIGYKKLFLKAMSDIEASGKQGHLLGPIAYIDKHHAEPGYEKKAMFGTTTHPLFEQIAHPPKTYRVKPGVGASKALESLLISHETGIECGVALNIAYYLVILWKMQQIHGEQAGRKRFDKIFGDADGDAPELRRLVISPFCTLMGTELVRNVAPLPAQPLSFVFGYKDLKTKFAIQSNVKIGEQIIFAGDPNYVKKHPAGTAGAYNCVVTCTNPLKVRTYNVGHGEVIEEDLYQTHIKAFAEQMSEESFETFESPFRTSAAFFKLAKSQTSRDKIPGFIPQIVAIDEDKLNFLLEAKIGSVLDALDVHLAQKTEYIKSRYLEEEEEKGKFVEPKEKEGEYERLQLFIKRIERLKLEQEAKILAEEKAAQAKKDASEQASKEDKPYAGLSGLAGAFASNTKKKKIPKKQVKPKQQSDYLPGFKAGFLSSKDNSSSNTSPKANQAKKRAQKNK